MPHPIRPVRDIYDWLMFAVGLAGLVAVIITIVVTLSNNTSSGRDVAKAIGKMADIASTLRDEHTTLVNETRATEKVATETQTLAAAAGKQADAAKQQAQTTALQLGAARQQLLLQELPNIDIDVRPASYTGVGAIDADAVIANRGVYTIHGQAYQAQAILGYGQPYQSVWSNEKSVAGPIRVSVVPGIDRRFPMSLAQPTEDQWQLISAGGLHLVFALKFVFKDATGTVRHQQQCLVITGPPQAASTQYC